MSQRRLQRLVLGASVGGFQSIHAMEFLLHSPMQKHPLVRQFCECFLPSLRYVNPSLSVRFLECPRSQEEDSRKTAAAQPSFPSSSSVASPAGFAGSAEAKVAEGPRGGGSSAENARGGPETLRKDCLRLFFGEGNGAHVINLQLYSHPHQLMQRLLDLDARWQQLQSLTSSPSESKS